MKSPRLAKAVALLVAAVFPVVAEAQCGWQQDLINAFKSQFPGDQSCRALSGSPREVWGPLENITTNLLSQKSAIGPYDQEYWHYQDWLNEYTERFSTASRQSSDQPRVVIVRNKMPDAYAAGRYVVLTTGLVAWFTKPQMALQQLGLSPLQATDFLNQLEKNNPEASPGPDGLVAIAAMEMAHNLLGHTDATPLAQACDSFIADQQRELYKYEQFVALGKKPGFWESIKLSFSGPSHPALPINELQQQSDADSLGSWLAWRTHGEHAELARALRWLALLPEQKSVPKTGLEAVTSMLCSDRNSLRSRADGLNSFHAWEYRSDPPQPVAALPVGEAMARFQNFQQWYPSRREFLDRIAKGDLTEEEKKQTVIVELEAKPKKAALLLDGIAQPEPKLKIPLTIGPHVIASSRDNKTAEEHIVVFDDGPKKFSVEVKK
jgi:hypothetical protein